MGTNLLSGTKRCILCISYFFMFAPSSHRISQLFLGGSWFISLKNGIWKPRSFCLVCLISLGYHSFLIPSGPSSMYYSNACTCANLICPYIYKSFESLSHSVAVSSSSTSWVSFWAPPSHLRFPLFLLFSCSEIRNVILIHNIFTCQVLYTCVCRYKQVISNQLYLFLSGK